MRYYLETYVNGEWVIVWTGTSYAEALEEAQQLTRFKIKEDSSC